MLGPASRTPPCLLHTLRDCNRYKALEEECLPVSDNSPLTLEKPKKIKIRTALFQNQGYIYKEEKGISCR